MKIKKLKEQIRNLRKLDVIISNKIIEEIDTSHLNDWITNEPCGARGCILGDYVLQNKMTPDNAALWETEVLPNGNVRIGNLRKFSEYCQYLDAKKEFGVKVPRDSAGYGENSEHAIFTSEDISYEKRLKLVRKQIKKLTAKLKSYTEN